jgi:hypothetical protein
LSHALLADLFRRHARSPKGHDKLSFATGIIAAAIIREERKNEDAPVNIDHVKPRKLFRPKSDEHTDRQLCQQQSQ